MSKEETIKIETPVIRGPYHRMRVPAETGEESLTHQSFRDMCDINNIVRRHAAGEMVTHVNKRPPQFMDVTPMDFREAMELTTAIRQEFDSLPAELRNQYENNPELYLAEQLQASAAVENETTAQQQKPSSDSAKPDSVDTESVPDDHAGNAAEPPI